MKKSILFFLLIGMTLLNSCETQEIVLTEQNNSNPIYNSVISNYLTNFKTSVSKNKENTKKISSLMQAVDYGSIKQYDLKNTIKLVVVDLKNFTVFPEAEQTKAIFFVLNNSIIRSNIVTIKNKLTFENPDQVIVSILDKKENKDNYSGKIEFYNLFQNILLSDEFDNGVLTKNSIALPNPKNAMANRSSCDDWYWLTTYSDGSQTAVYLYTTCDPCSGGGGELFKNSDCDSGSGGGGSGYSSTGQPDYPANPNDTDTITYTNEEGELITEKYDAKEKRWKLNKTELSEVIVRNNYKNKYDFLNKPNMNKKQPVIFEEIIYKYDLASGSWEGAPATDETIAQAIEDQIDDSKLDPCTKGVLDKLKNLTQNDIAKIFEKFGVPVNGTYNIQMVLGTPIADDALADTKTISKNNYIITIRDTYIQGAYNNQKKPTDLAVAAVIIHELIHAHFKGLFDDYHNNGDTCAYDNYNCLYEKYVTKNFTGDTDAQHTQMFNSYIDIMASALQEFHPGLSSQYYDDLAMSTMYGLKYFDNKYPIGSIERTRIENNRLAEDRNTPKGTATPKGTPCN